MAGAAQRRAFVVVLDACGVGALPDAGDYGDAGTNTLAHVAEAVGGLDLPVLAALGLGSIVPLMGIEPTAHPVLHGRLHALGPGKDSATGHWELMGAVPPRPLPTYPKGFPPEIVDRIREISGRDILCNRPYNGIAAIDDLGAEHLETGALILYTSQDSVLQLAAHVERVPEAELHALCADVRAFMVGEHAVGRVIARPFKGEPGAFARTLGRRDLAVPPPGPTYLEALEAAGAPVHAVGKVGDFFAGHGIGARHPGATNAVALAETGALLDGLETGLVFTNLVETDQRFGHRKDVHGFHGALRDIDAAVGEWLARMRPGDLLVLCADHGCDPDHPLTDHTREHVPVLAVWPDHAARRHDGPLADVGASAHAWLTGGEEPELPGSSFI